MSTWVSGRGTMAAENIITGACTGRHVFTRVDRKQRGRQDVGGASVAQSNHLWPPTHSLGAWALGTSSNHHTWGHTCMYFTFQREKMRTGLSWRFLTIFWKKPSGIRMAFYSLCMVSSLLQSTTVNVSFLLWALMP